MEISLIKQIQESVNQETAFWEGVDATTPTTEIADKCSTVVLESAEKLMNKIYAQLGAGKPIEQTDANTAMGLYALADPTIGKKLQEQLMALKKQGTPIRVALQLAGDDAAVNQILQSYGEQYVNNSQQGVPYKLRSMMLSGNVLDEKQRQVIMSRVQRAGAMFRESLAKQQAAENQPMSKGAPPVQAARSQTTSGQPSAPMGGMRPIGGSGTTGANSPPAA